MDLRCLPALCLVVACGGGDATPGPADAGPDAADAPSGLSISELQARNERTLLDENGDSSDWLEVHHGGSMPVDLAGWHLTDDGSDRTLWTFPAVTVGPGEHLVVFASGKDRRVAGAELHTNFGLDGGGEWLALVAPDGSIVDMLSFPRQVRDASYGTALEGPSIDLIAPGAAGRWLVPGAPAELPAGWAGPTFDDSAWTSGNSAFGFDRGDDPGDPTELVNAALGKPAVQSSTLGDFAAALAVDGDPGNFTHTAARQSLPATWQVDLQATIAVHRVVLGNRQGCCQSRLRDLTVSVLADDGAVVFQSELLNPENGLGGGGLGGPATLTVDLVARTGAPVRGRTVRVVRTPDPDLSGSGGQGNSDEADVLSLAEVEVMTAPPPRTYDELIRGDLGAAMAGRNPSAFIRLPFELDASTISGDVQLLLRMRYDDGFIAYLNGIEVARRNAEGAPGWNGAASAEHPEPAAFVAERIDLSPFRDALVDGANVLAIHGLNLNADDGDFLILPELVARTIDGEARRYFATPTPGAPNGEDTFTMVADVELSVAGGLHDAPRTLVMRTATTGATIRYTTDGSPPTATSGTVYAQPLVVDRTTVVRAAAFASGSRPSVVTTRTYVFPRDVASQDVQATRNAGFPATWGGVSPDYGMDPDVIGPAGLDRFGGKYTATIADDLRAVPTMSIVLPIDEMFGPGGIYTNSTARGVAWERAASVELFHPDGTPGFQIDCGIRVQGGAFRDHSLTRKHSLRLNFKDEYGPGKLEYPLFGPDATDRFDSLVLRANSNDGWQWSAAGGKPLYIRDSFGRETLLAMGGVAAHEIFVHLYINGIYWGLYNPVERPDHRFSASYFGGEADAWDAINSGSVTNGSLAAWSAMLTLARQGLSTLAAYHRILGRDPDGTRNPAYPVHLDVDNLIDYMIVNLYGGNSDWPHKNYWIGRDSSAASTGFKFYMWDSEWSLGLQSSLTTDRTTVASGVAEPYALLRASPEFRLRVGDRLHRALFAGGPLFVDAAAPAWDPARPERNQPAARFARLAATVQRALVAESARWGDQHATAAPYARDEHWAVERDALLASYFPQRSARVLDQFRAIGLYPPVAAPTFSQHGGVVADGFEVFLGAGAGTIHYTLDGQDPRLASGDTRPGALSTPPPGGLVAIGRTTTVRARALAGGAWSALTEATFVPSSQLGLRITEVMYHPRTPDLPTWFSREDFEFIELMNVGARPIDASAYRLRGAVELDLGAAAAPVVQPGQRIVAVASRAAFASRYPDTSAASVVGEYRGRLGNGAETLELTGPAGRQVLAFTYRDDWRPETDGRGYSLTIVDAQGAPASWTNPASWTASSVVDGTPGR